MAGLAAPSAGSLTASSSQPRARPRGPRVLGLSHKACATRGQGFTEHVLDMDSARMVGIDLIWATVWGILATLTSSSYFLGKHPGLAQLQES